MRRVAGIVLCLWLASLWGQALAGFPGGFLAVGAGSGGSSGLNVTFAVVNDSASATPSQSVTQTKLIPFKDGDVCSGNAPIFTDQSNGHVLHWSYGLATYWASGCLMNVTVMWRLDSSVAGSGSHTIAMTCCGSWPAQGAGTAGQARTLTEVYAQNLVVSMPAAPGLTTVNYGANLTGTWGSWLKSDANNYKVTKWLDGDAGTAWKISTDMAQTQGGAAHGQLRFDHYIEALTDSTGNLGGFRWLGMARQPKYNNDTPAKNWRAFAIPDCVTPSNGPNWSVGGGSATPLTWKGGDGNCMVPQAFTVAGSGQLIHTSAANNYYFGSYNDGNAIPAYLSGASLPSSSVAIDTATVYFIRSNQSTHTGHGANTQLEINGHGAPQNSNAQAICSVNPNTCAFTSSGSGTITPIPLLMPFTRITFADPNGRYNFFQGTGSITAETTLRVQINQTYWQSTGLIPPYMLSISGASKGGNVAEAVFDEPTLAYNPWNIGSFNQTQQDVGEHGDLGPWPDDAAIWFYNDTAKDDFIVRSEGLSAALTPYDFKDATLDMPINIRDAQGTSTYTGLPNSVATTVDLNFQTGFTAPPLGNGSSVFSNTDGSHKPNYADPAWMMTGELQYLDLIIDQAIGGIANQDTTNRNPTSPDTLKAIYIGFFGNGETRTRAWVGRDAQTAAARCPYDPTLTATVYTFGGTQLCKYLRDIAADNTKFAVDVQNPANTMYGSSTTYIDTRGIFLGGPNINSGLAPLGVVPCCGGYESTYTVYGFNIAAKILGDANANTWLNTYISSQNYTLNTYGGFNLYAIADLEAAETGGNYGTPVISDDNHWAMKTEEWQSSLSWASTGSPYFTQGLPTAGTYVPAAGDVFIFCGSAEGCTPPGGFSAYTPYFVRDVVNHGTNVTLNLSATNGGTAIAATNSGSQQGPGWWHTTLSNAPLSSVNGAFPANSDFVTVGRRAAVGWAKAIVGGTGANAVLTDANARLAAEGYDYGLATGNGVRYSMQDHFGP